MIKLQSLGGKVKMKILIGISGGVDSTYAARLLQRAGHEVEGALLIMHEYTEADAALSAADSVGIKLHTVDCRDEFNNIVKRNFVSEYLSARTPNPCIICNERVKFAGLHSFAMANGFDKISTGHYADVAITGNGSDMRYSIRRGCDLTKDQSYMLYRLPQNVLSSLVLPLSSAEKSAVRSDAESEGLVSANRPDSQEICFLPNGAHAEYVESVGGASKKGNFIDVNGKIIAPHKGIAHYTVGQRKGLGVSLGERAFISEINPQTGDITLSTQLIGKNEIRISSLVFQSLNPDTKGIVEGLKVKLRYTAPLTDTVAELCSDGTAILHFDSPVRSAPGQSAVLYDGDLIAFGGIIC